MRCFLATAGLAVLAACSGDAQPPTDSAATDAAGGADTAQAASEPLAYDPPLTLSEATEGPSEIALYRFGDQDTTVYILGTVHVLRPDVAWKTDGYRSAFDAADAIYVEADVSEEAMAELQPVAMRLGLNPQGTTLSSYFTEEERERLSVVLGELGVPLQNLEPLRPWLASTMIGAAGIQKLGGDPAAGVETIIEADAEAAGKPVRTLETGRQQLEMLASPPDQAWADALIADIDEYAEFERYFAKLIGAWYDGRMDVVGELMNDGLNADRRLAEVLLYERNEDWAGQLDRLVEGEAGTFLVAVGAGHLAGENSVQDYLKEAGYEVTRQ